MAFDFAAVERVQIRRQFSIGEFILVECARQPGDGKPAQQAAADAQCDSGAGVEGVDCRIGRAFHRDRLAAARGHDLLSDGIGFAFCRIVWLAEDLCRTRGCDAAGLLHDVRQLMRQQRNAARSAGRVLVGAEYDVPTKRECQGVDRLRRRCRCRPGMHAHLAEIMLKARFHVPAGVTIECLPLALCKHLVGVEKLFIEPRFIGFFSVQARTFFCAFRTLRHAGNMLPAATTALRKPGDRGRCYRCLALGLSSAEHARFHLVSGGVVNSTGTGGWPPGFACTGSPP